MTAWGMMRRRGTTMNVPLQITYREIASSDAVDAHVRGHVERLGRIADSIVSCHVVLTAGGFGPQRENPYFEVHIDLLVPGHTISIDHEPTPKHEHDDLYAAIDRAFARVTRELGDLSDRDDRSGQRPAR